MYLLYIYFKAIKDWVRKYLYNWPDKMRSDNSFLALLAKGQRAYVMVSCPSSVRPSVRPSVWRKQFWCCNDNSNKFYPICFKLWK